MSLHDGPADRRVNPPAVTVTARVQGTLYYDAGLFDSGCARLRSLVSYPS